MKEQRLFAVASQCPKCYWAKVQVFYEGEINEANLTCNRCSTKGHEEHQTIRAITSIEDVPERRR